MRKDRRR